MTRTEVRFVGRCAERRNVVFVDVVLIARIATREPMRIVLFE